MKKKKCYNKKEVILLKTEESKKKMMLDIQEKASKLGRAPRQKEIGYTYREIQQCFGSMKEAIRESLTGFAKNY